LLRINHLKTYFFQRKDLLSKLFGQGMRIVRAVDDVSLNIKKGRTFGLVGESGCGKSTLGQSIFRMVEPIEGEILYKDQNVIEMDQKSLRAYRQSIHLVFQDQFGCLDPRMTAGQIIAEPIINYQSNNHTNEDVTQKVLELLKAVNLDPQNGIKFPHEFSGGQARRIGIARAISLDPDFIVADEPTSGLDISTAATILNLLKDLQERLDVTYLWISHDLNQVKYMADDIAIMYLGKIVETGKTADVFKNLAHPYSQALVSAVPQVGTTNRGKKIVLSGEVPSPLNPPMGCRFHTRCPNSFKRCEEEEPQPIDLGSGHFAACHLLGS